MAVNEVIYNGKTLIDLKSDTVTPETLAEGVTAHDASGNKITGIATIKPDTTEYEVVDSIEEMTDTSKQYVLRATNTIWTYGETQVDDTDRNLFDASKVTINANPDGTTRAGAFTTDYVPVDIDYSSPYNVQIAGLDETNVTIPDLYKIAYYNASKTNIGIEYANTIAKTKNGTKDYSYQIGYKNDGSGKLSYHDNIAYVRLLCRASTSASITQSNVPTNITITTPEPKIRVEYTWFDTGMKPSTGGGYSDVPTYHYVECGRVIDLIRDFKKSHSNSLIFGAVSDIHVFNNDATHEEKSKAGIKHASFALEMVGAMAECDFIANLGDNAWENGIDTDNALIGAKYSINALKPAFDRLTRYNLVGNHDKSDNTQLQYDLIGSYNEFDAYSPTRIRGFGYKDYTDKKVRVIVLNTCDYLNASGGCALSYEQKDFLMRALDLSGKGNSANWQILLLSHIPLDWNGGDYNFYTDLQVILNAYESGTEALIKVNSSYALNENPSSYSTYSNGIMGYNYYGKNSAKIIANIHGHVHTNKIGKIANTDIARVATANTNPDLNKSESYPTYGDYSITTTEAAKIAKVAGTAKDTSATFYCIDLDEQIIYAYGYGADVDRVVPYKAATIYTITYNLTNATTSCNDATVEKGGVFACSVKAVSGYELGTVTVTMGGVDVTSSVYSNGQITIDEATGNIVITARAEAVASYKNIIDEVGTIDNVRLRSGGATAIASGFASNYFSVKAGDVIRVYFPNGNRASIPSNGVYACLYSAKNDTALFAYDSSTSSSILKNVTDKGYEIHIPADVTCSYARVAGGPNGAYAGWIVTVNEEIK